jgi:hypothetical protein
VTLTMMALGTQYNATQPKGFNIMTNTIMTFIVMTQHNNKKYETM